MQHYESLILEAKEENEKEIAEAIEKACSHKLQKMQLKLDKVNEEKMFLDDVSLVIEILHTNIYN